MSAGDPTSFCPACGHAVADRFCGFCGTNSLSCGAPGPLCFDGVYVTKPVVERGIISRQYFRFYPDRFACGIGFASKKDTGVATWWGRRGNDGQRGFYRLKGREIEMACMGDTQALVYRGRLHKGGLIITWCNGTECRRVYRFVEGREGEHPRERT